MIEVRNESDLRNWFKNNYKKVGFSKIISSNHQKFPDFVVLEGGKKVRIELEIKSSNFLLYHHPIKKVDKVICIKKDIDLKIPIIELKNFKLVKFNKKIYHSLGNQIYRIIKKERIVTTSEILNNLKVSWNTAEKYLLELIIDGKIVKIKKLGVNLWMLK